MNTFISDFVRIRNAEVIKNGEKIFQLSSEPELQAAEFYRLLKMSYPKFFKMDLLAQWGMVTAELLLQNSSLLAADPFRVALLFQNITASSHADQAYQKTLQEIPSPALFVYTLPNIVMGEIAIRHSIKGENTFIVSKEFSSEHLVEYAQTLFDQDIADELILAFLEIGSNEADIFMLRISTKPSSHSFSKDTLLQLYETPLKNH
ncbi:MAG: hypothetical protein IPN26_03750 [Bacteroidetes bacterium]|nr:hypothetical protein [Bacteroidota bacterium]